MNPFWISHCVFQGTFMIRMSLKYIPEAHTSSHHISGFDTIGCASIRQQPRSHQMKCESYWDVRGEPNWSWAFQQWISDLNRSGSLQGGEPLQWKRLHEQTKVYYQLHEIAWLHTSLTVWVAAWMLVCCDWSPSRFVSVCLVIICRVHACKLLSSLSRSRKAWLKRRPE